MIISDKNKFILFHIPKTGGNTRAMRLSQYQEREKYFKNSAVSPVNETKHIRYIDILEAQDILGYYKAVFVRNPYDLIYSGYIESLFLNRVAEMSFHDYLFVFLPEVRESKLYTCPNQHCQHEFTHYKGKNMMNFCGRVENHDDEFELMLGKMGLKSVAEVPPQNARTPVSNGYRYLDKYTPEAIELLNHLYEKDFQHFGYPMLDPDSYMEHVNDIISLPPILD